MRILLIDPPFYRFMGYYTRFFPYGLASLAAHARALGHEPLVLDADHDPKARGIDYQAMARLHAEYLKRVSATTDPVWEELRRSLRSLAPQWVGITALTAKMASVLQVAAVVREVLPHVPIVVGGAHAMVRPVEILRNGPEVDAVVVGEGEPVLEHLLTESRAALSSAARSIPGLITRESGGTITEAPPADLGLLASPARDCFVRGSYAREDLGLLMTSRGCPYGCTYCFSKGLWRRRVRFVPVDLLFSEFEWLRSVGVRHVTFKDDVFTLDRARTLALCRCLRDTGLTFDCVTRADRLDEELLCSMKRDGCTAVKIGVETGSERMMERLDRSIDPGRIREAARLLRDIGLHWTAYFMMGLPGETLEDLEQTHAFMRELRPDFASLSGYEAFPGTGLFAQAREAGIVCDTMDRAEFFRVSPHDYYFSRDDRGMILPPGVTYSDVESAMHARFHRYNASLPRLVKRFRSRMAVWRGEPMAAVQDAVRLTSWLGSRPRRPREGLR